LISRLNGHKKENLFGVFHCFTGTLEDAQRAISYNLKLGIGGVVTFKNGKIDQFLAQLPLSSLVLETDAPYLAPVPHRGKRNESAYISLVVNRLSEIYTLPEEEIIKATSIAAKEVFKTKT
jgi:TatD DNase family protein